jgi:hypothetical protein
MERKRSEMEYERHAKVEEERLASKLRDEEVARVEFQMHQRIADLEADRQSRTAVEQEKEMHQSRLRELSLKQQLLTERWKSEDQKREAKLLSMANQRQHLNDTRHRVTGQRHRDQQRLIDVSLPIPCRTIPLRYYYLSKLMSGEDGGAVNMK